MILWADADSLPPGVRELCARRHGRQANQRCTEPVEVVFVAAKAVRLPAGSQLVQLPAGPDGPSADDFIIERARAGDVLVTRDLPLAGRAIALGMHAMNDRGDIWTADTIRERLSVRDQMAALRASGLAPMGGSSYGRRELTDFANALDRLLQAWRPPELSND